ncbi:MAG: glycosyltransferase family 4 protein [Chloroflexota bacterium]
MRVLHLLGDRRLPPDPEAASSSGVVRAALEFARAQAEHGHDVTIASVGAEQWETRWRGVRLTMRHGIPWARVSVAGRSVDFRTHLAYMLYATLLRPDVIHSHAYYYLRFLRAGRRVVHFHADPMYSGRGDVRTDFSAADFALVARHSDVQIANSRFVAGQVQSGLRGAGNVHTISYGVDHARFDPHRAAEDAAQLRNAWGVRPDEPVLLYAGAIVPEKGVIHLARAYRRLGADAPHLVLAGGRTLWGGGIHHENDGGYDSTVYAELADGIANGRVHPLGNVPADQMAAVYTAADILVVPSVWKEAFGMVALEAAACGKPVIASATGGLAEAVTPDMGIQVPPGDEDALVNALRALLGNAERRRTLGEAARAHAARFNWPTAAEQVEHLYSPPPTMHGRGVRRSTA